MSIDPTTRMVKGCDIYDKNGQWVGTVMETDVLGMLGSKRPVDKPVFRTVEDYEAMKKEKE